MKETSAKEPNDQDQPADEYPYLLLRFYDMYIFTLYIRIY